MSKSLKIVQFADGGTNGIVHYIVHSAYCLLALRLHTGCKGFASKSHPPDLPYLVGTQRVSLV